MKSMFRAAVLSWAVMGVSLACAQQPAPADQAQSAPVQQNQADVPVRSVVLYTSGVGYFEHSGQVNGDAHTELRFKTDQINDILKSLVLEDQGGGTIRSITYPSQDPIGKTLRSFQVDISDNPDLAELLNRLRGAQVVLQSAEGQLSGTVLGVENRQIPGGPAGGAALSVPVVKVLTGGTIRAIDLPGLRSIELADAQLRQELNQALVALAQSRGQDKKPVVIDFSGQGQRRVRLGYVVQTPIWKTSYRLVLGSGDEKPRLQGWAIVENQTDNDWSDVNLSLISGRPISFVQDLYQPLYIQRPVVEPELYTSLNPQRYGGGMAEGAADNVALAAPAPAAAGGSSLREVRSRKADAAAQSYALARTAEEKMDIGRSVSSIAQAGDMGELFQYVVPHVTLARQQSAMLPIVTDEISAQRVSIYNESVLADHPLNGAQLKNTTGKHLLAGPITVFDDGAYAGDAQIENLPPDQSRLISYGIDLKMLVRAGGQDSRSEVTTGRIVKGVLELTYKSVQSRQYVADNKADKARSLIIEHPIMPGWELVDSPKPQETTAQVYRFATEVAAGKQQTIKISQQNIHRQAVALLPLDLNGLMLYQRSGEIPQAVRDALAKAGELKRALAETELQIAAKQEKLESYPAQQTRLRENMKVIERTSDLYAGYMKRLQTQEQEILQLQDELETLKKQAQTQRQSLETYLLGLNVG